MKAPGPATKPGRLPVRSGRKSHPGGAIRAVRVHFRYYESNPPICSWTIVEKLIDLGRFALGHHLDAAVGEVSHVTGELEAVCQPSASRSKPHSLDSPGIADPPSLEGHEIP